MHTLTIALFLNKTDNQPRTKEITWEKLATLLTEHEERGEKDGRLWSPTSYHEGTTRGKESVEQVFCLVLDFDDGIAPGPFRKQWERWEYVLYSTFSHSPDFPKWRAVFLLSNPIAAEDWQAVYAKLAAALGQGHTDPSCKDCSRIYYTPASLPDAPRFAERHAGEALEPGAFPDYACPFPGSIEPRESRSGVPAPAGTGDFSTLDIVGLFQAHGAYGRDMGRGQHAVRCPWESEHSQASKAEDSDSCIWEADGSGLWPQYKCLHAHCESRSIRDVLDLWTDASSFCARQFPLTRQGTSNGSDPARPMMTLSEAKELGETTRERMKDDPRSAFEQLPLYAFGLLKAHVPGDWVLCKQAFAACKIGIREVEKSIPPVVLAPEDRPPEEETITTTAGASLPGCPIPNLIIPHPYLLSASMTGKRVFTDAGPIVVPVVSAPILFTGRTINPVTGDESLRLTWRWRDSEWKSRIVERQNVMTIRGITKLSGIGFPVSDISSTEVVTYLDKLEVVNRGILPVAKVTSHLGWQGRPAEAASFLIGRSLVRPDGTIIHAPSLDMDDPDTWSKDTIFFHGLGEGEEQIVDAFGTEGTLEAWIEAISVLRQFPRALIGLYAAFAAPLLAVFNVPNFAVDYANKTSTGKTTILRVVGSVWGNPDERTAASIVGTWDASRVWAERAGHIMNGLPLILDDTMKARNERAIVEQIYAVISGRGRGRGTVGGIAQTSNWRTVLFSSGEQPATSKTQDGGARTRVLSFVGLPFGRADTETGQLIKRLNTALCSNYGHPGLAFMAWFQSKREKWADWKQQYQHLVSLFSASPPSPEAGRLAEYVALIFMTGQMVHTALKLPWEFVNPFAEEWAELAKQANDAAGDLRALEHVASWARSRQHTFYGRFEGELTGGTARLPHSVSGRWDRGDWQSIAFYPSVLRQVLKDEGFDPDMTLRNWRENGWLDAQPGGFTTNIKMGGEQEKVIKIRRSAIESTNIDGNEVDTDE